ncbi:MAG: phosphoribosylamine--glycine ligase [Candidatus Cloacimonetes bacterium]|nr:phosphoribosylamine--glycine ligase [Candidatus Cloacimonadota bacterium]
MNILVIGSGGREHAIARQFLKSRLCTNVFVSPGNAGMKDPISIIELKNVGDIIDFVKKENINFVFIGPEQPLAEGITDKLSAENIDVIGPTQYAAQIETSKVFAKNFMEKFAIPTAKYRVFNDYESAVMYLSTCSFPQVIKADGLAGGKGVVIVSDYKEAKSAVSTIMSEKKFGNAGANIVIEEFLQGWETSVFAFCDGKNFVSTIFSQDHKAVYDGDNGPNTGGMGAYAPVSVNDDFKHKIDESIFRPIIDGFIKEGHPYKGILFAGLMITPQGPYVLEYNARFGDPETEVVLPLLKTDFSEICQAIINQKLDTIKLEWENKACVTVVAASGGYPGSFEKDKPITFTPDFRENDNLLLFTAGVKKTGRNLVTSGGRVLMLTAKADTLQSAINLAYDNMNKINFERIYYRTDIGKKGLFSERKD